PGAGALHDLKQGRGVLRVQPHAAMRGRRAETLNLVTAVDRVAALEEDRMRHRRAVILARKPIALEALGAIDPDGGDVAAARGRDRPGVAVPAVDADRHLLG